MKKRKLAESIAKDINEHDAHQVSKRLCTPTEGTEDPAVINLVVEDTEEKELVEYRFKVTPQMVEETVKDMKDYLLEIAGVPPSEDRPLPHLSATKHGCCSEDTRKITKIWRPTIWEPTPSLITSSQM